MKKTLKILILLNMILVIGYCNTVEAKATTSTNNVKKSIVSSQWDLKNGKWYYYDEDCTIKKDWAKIAGVWYYFDNNGEMQTGWKKINNKWYYLNSNGSMQIGWKVINNKWYYLNNDGVMQTSWIKWNNNYYYLNNNGEMQVGSQNINNKTYYFNENGTVQTTKTQGQAILNYASQFLEKPYVWGAKGPDAFDCSGFTSYVFRHFGYELPGTTYDQINQGVPISYEDLQPGDLVFERGSATEPAHVAIYWGNGQIIHAANPRDGVKIGPITEYVAARRIL